MPNILVFCQRLLSIITLTALALAGTTLVSQTAMAGDWQTYEYPIFGTKVEIPASFKSIPVKKKKKLDPDIALFKSPDGLGHIRIYRELPRNELGKFCFTRALPFPNF